MNAKPIPMHGRSIHSIMAGRKTQTRRIIGERERIGYSADQIAYAGHGGFRTTTGLSFDWAFPYGKPGDLLWVREPWKTLALFDSLPPRDIDRRARIVYLSDGADTSGRYRQARFMCRWMSRLTLHLTDVRVERVQEITEDDAKAEGAPRGFPGDDGEFHYSDFGTHYGGFAELWEHTNGHDAWDRNDWCWCLHFRVIEANVDDVLAQPGEYGINGSNQ